jgi:hypothetical protein
MVPSIFNRWNGRTPPTGNITEFEIKEERGLEREGNERGIKSSHESRPGY